MTIDAGLASSMAADALSRGGGGAVTWGSAEGGSVLPPWCWPPANSDDRTSVLARWGRTGLDESGRGDMLRALLQVSGDRLLCGIRLRVSGITGGDGSRAVPASGATNAGLSGRGSIPVAKGWRDCLLMWRAGELSRAAVSLRPYCGAGE